MKRQSQLPISGRDTPEATAWLHENTYLIEAGARSIKTEMTYRSGLRLYADWMQHFERDGYDKKMEWPLPPGSISTATVLAFRNWLVANRSKSTATTYMSAVVGYLNFLDGMDLLPEQIQLGKLRRQLERRKIETSRSETVVDLDAARQAVPTIVTYYDSLPLPANDSFDRRLSVLRNRALVHVLYSTAARLGETLSLNRSGVDHGRSAHATIVGKGNRARTIHLREYAQLRIRSYLGERKDSNPALFVAHSRNARNARLSPTSAHMVIKKAVRALALHESISAHDFRHYRATQLLREGMPLEVVQEYLGHVDISTTRSIYAPVLGVQIVAEWLDNMDVPPDEAAELS